MHTKLLTLLLVCAGAGAGAAAAAPAAHADVYCVKKPGCSGPGRHDASDLATALYEAQLSHSTSDVINLGEGEFATDTGFVYDATGEPANGLRIVGSGPKTVLRASSPTTSLDISVLTLRGTDPASTSVEQLSVRVPNGLGAPTSGLRLIAARAEHVGIAGDGGGAMTGAQLGDGGELRFARVDVGDGTAVGIGSGKGRLEDAELAGGTGIGARSEESSVSRVRIRASGYGVVQSGGVMSLDDAAILLTAPGATGITESGGTGGSAIAASYLTVATTQPATTGVVASSNNDDLAFVRLENSVVSGTKTALAAYGPLGKAIIETRHSNYDPAATKAEGAFADLIEDAVTTHPPGFVDLAGGDLRLRPGSELIDIGAPAPAPAAATDAVRNPRVVGGTPDLGAYEYQALAPKARIAAPGRAAAGGTVTFDGSGSSDGDAGDKIAAWKWSLPGGTTAIGPKVARTFPRAGSYTVKLTVTDTTGRTGTAVRTVTVLAPPARADRTAPVVSRLRVAPRRAGRRARIRFAVSEPAAVVVKVRRRGGKRVAVLRRTVGAGAVSLRTPRRLRHGRYRVVITAADAAGNRAIPARRAFRVREAGRTSGM